MTLWIICSIIFGLLISAAIRTCADPERVKNSGTKLCWTFAFSIFLWIIWMISAGIGGGFHAWLWAAILPIVSCGVSLVFLLFWPIDWPLPLRKKPDDWPDRFFDKKGPCGGE